MHNYSTVFNDSTDPVGRAQARGCAQNKPNFIARIAAINSFNQKQKMRLCQISLEPEQKTVALHTGKEPHC